VAPASPEPAFRLSVIVPTLNEAAGIGDALDALAPLRAAGHEVVVADGGSTDGTLARCQSRADVVLAAPRGRARQMNAGVQQARGDVLLFLHADTRLPPGATALISAAVQRGAHWGRFDVRIAAARWPHRLALGVVAAAMNLRSRLTGIATGDQAMFVLRTHFEALGGFADLPLMEDIELSRRLRARSPPACLRERVLTSGRRWETRGVLPTVWLMWRLRWRYWRGAPAEELARLYR